MPPANAACAPRQMAKSDCRLLPTRARARWRSASRRAASERSLAVTSGSSASGEEGSALLKVGERAACDASCAAACCAGDADTAPAAELAPGAASPPPPVSPPPGCRAPACSLPPPSTSSIFASCVTVGRSEPVHVIFTPCAQVQAHAPAALARTYQWQAVPHQFRVSRLSQQVLLLSLVALVFRRLDAQQQERRPLR